MSAVSNINSHSRDDSSSSLLNLRGPFVCRDCIAIPVPKLASIEAGRVVALQRTEAMHMPSNRPRRHARGGRRCSPQTGQGRLQSGTSVGRQDPTMEASVLSLYELTDTPNEE